MINVTFLMLHRVWRLGQQSSTRMGTLPVMGADAGSSTEELTIDQLAAAVGLTVRTVRSYTTRGLLPPPRLRGRTGLYGA